MLWDIGHLGSTRNKLMRSALAADAYTLLHNHYTVPATAGRLAKKGDEIPDHRGTQDHFANQWSGTGGGSERSIITSFAQPSASRACYLTYRVPIW